MRVYSLEELLDMSRGELFALHGQIAILLTEVPDGSAEYQIRLQTLRDIRQAIARPTRRRAPACASMVPR